MAIPFKAPDPAAHIFYGLHANLFYYYTSLLLARLSLVSQPYKTLSFCALSHVQETVITMSPCVTNLWTFPWSYLLCRMGPSALDRPP